MKICLTSYFGLREALLAAAEALRTLGHEVIDYPLFAKNVHLETRINDVVEDFSRFLQDERPDGVLWWCLSISSDSFVRIKGALSGLKYWYFNWDEPFNWHDAELAVKAPHFDAVFVCCQETTQRWLDHGCPRAVYCLPGFDPELFRPLEPEEYRYDVSMVLTNLYGDRGKYPDQAVNRRELIDQLYQKQGEHGYRLALFGPEFLGDLYPESYVGYCRYEDLNQIFNESRINLTTHVIGNRAGYLNERTVTLIGSGSLILIDPIKELDQNLLDKRTCLVLDPERPVEQIKRILKNYDSYQLVKNSIKKIRNNYTWKIWAEKIHLHIYSE
jgi:hypothetical protein